MYMYTLYIYIYTHTLIYLFICLHQLLVEVYGIQFSDQGLNPGPLYWELRILATGLLGKSLLLLLVQRTPVATKIKVL